MVSNIFGGLFIGAIIINCFASVILCYYNIKTDIAYRKLNKQYKADNEVKE